MSKIVNDQISNDLQRLMHEHPEFEKLASNDATVYSWVRTALTHENREFVGSAEEILVGIIVQLGNDKQGLTDSHVKHMQLCTTPTSVRLQS